MAETEVAQLLRPVPTMVADAVGEPSERHEQLARRYGEVRARLVATRARVDDVARADEEAARRAIAQGKPMPKAKLPSVQDELAEAERELAIVTELVRPSAETLLAAALEVAADVEAKAQADADEAIETVLDHLRSAREALGVAATLRYASAWCAQLRESATVAPFTTRTAASRGGQAIVSAIAQIQDDEQRRVEAVEEYAREKAAVNSVKRGDVLVELPPPPTYDELHAERA
jgi:hypothetical protein